MDKKDKDLLTQLEEQGKAELSEQDRHRYEREAGFDADWEDMGQMLQKSREALSGPEEKPHPHIKSRLDAAFEEHRAVRVVPLWKRSVPAWQAAASLFLIAIAVFAFWQAGNDTETLASEIVYRDKVIRDTVFIPEKTLASKGDTPKNSLEKPMPETSGKAKEKRRKNSIPSVKNENTEASALAKNDVSKPEKEDSKTLIEEKDTSGPLALGFEPHLLAQANAEKMKAYERNQIRNTQDSAAAEFVVLVGDRP